MGPLCGPAARRPAGPCQRAHRVRNTCAWGSAGDSCDNRDRLHRVALLCAGQPLLVHASVRAVVRPHRGGRVAAGDDPLQLLRHHHDQPGARPGGPIARSPGPGRGPHAAGPRGGPRAGGPGPSQRWGVLDRGPPNRPVEAPSLALRPRVRQGRSSIRPLLPLGVERHRPLQLPLLHWVPRVHVCGMHIFRGSRLPPVSGEGLARVNPAWMARARERGPGPAAQRVAGCGSLRAVARLPRCHQPDDDRVLPQPLQGGQGAGARLRVSELLRLGHRAQLARGVRHRPRMPPAGTGVAGAPRKRH
mmetsp:Transcript_357/g.1245  ORF Transcript_357/g.1245 Transcript_357/m.1245 type:complete len:303 (+) Transcript_357:224-1132(+)